MTKSRRSTNRQYDQSEARPSTCRKCGSTHRHAYFGSPQIRIFDVVQRRPDGTEFSRLIRRRTKCLDCGQFRFDLSYEFHQADQVNQQPAKPSGKRSARKKAEAPLGTGGSPPAHDLPMFLNAAASGSSPQND